MDRCGVELLSLENAVIAHSLADARVSVAEPRASASDLPQILITFCITFQARSRGQSCILSGRRFIGRFPGQENGLVTEQSRQELGE